MAKNKLEDVRDHLFAQLERLGDEDMTQEQLDLEIKRARSIATVSSQIIETAKVEVDFIEAIGETDASVFWKGQKQIGN